MDNIFNMGTIEGDEDDALYDDSAKAPQVSKVATAKNA
jgi:hypothetical protein